MHHFVLGTAGHVDHGKTTLIKALTDVDCDTHKEEKERGITINLGFTHLKLPAGDVIGIVDVPGHKDFIKTMIAGAFGMDMVLLVVAADSGIMPQTREHLQIIDLLGVKKGLVALTRKDLVDEETLELAQLEVAELLEGTALKDAPVIPVSSVTREGLDELTDEIVRLIPQITEKPENNLFRMYIDRVFHVKGVGHVVTGTVLGGALRTGDHVYLLPGKDKPLKVKNMQRHGGAVSRVRGGDRAALHLAGFKREDYRRGMVLSEKYIEPVTMIDASLDLFPENRELGIRTQAIFYTGTFACVARIHLLNKDTLKKGERGWVQIHLETPAVLLHNDRYIIRSSASDLTLGGGVVIDVTPLHHRRRTPKLLQSLKELAEASGNGNRLFNLLKLELRKQKQPLLLEELAKALDVAPEELLDEYAGNQDRGVVTGHIQGQHLFAGEEVYKYFVNTVLDALQSHHRIYYLLNEGMETAGFYGKFNIRLNQAGKLFLLVVLNRLQAEQVLKNVGSTWALAAHQPEPDHKSQQQLAWLAGLLKSYDKQTPLMREVEKEAAAKKINKEHLRMLLRVLVKEGKIRVSEGAYIHSEIVNDVRNRLLPVLMERERGINEKEFRLLFDSTKAFVKTMTRILLADRLITRTEFYIHITEKGKSLTSR